MQNAKKKKIERKRKGLAAAKSMQNLSSKVLGTVIHSAFGDRDLPH
jgi:hypothetical protein